MLLQLLLSVEPAPDSLFGRWEVWEYFQKADTTPLPEEPQGYTLKLGNHIALQDTWYDRVMYRFLKNHPAIIP